jgi:hypothetical protein
VADGHQESQKTPIRKKRAYNKRCRNYKRNNILCEESNQSIKLRNGKNNKSKKNDSCVLLEDINLPES